MPITAPRYYLKAVSGASSPINEVTGTDALTGGTISLENLGSEYAWRFSGAKSTAAFTAMSINSDGNFESPGELPRVFAVRMRVQTAPTGGTYFPFPRLIGFSHDTDLDDNGTKLINGGSDTDITVRTPLSEDSASLGNFYPAGGSVKTVVWRITPGTSGNPDTLAIWVETVGRSGSTADYTGAGSTYTEVAQAYANAIVQPGTSGVLDVVRLVAFPPEAISDADCAALADNIDSAMAGATVDQEGFRFGADDGSEASHTWAAAQDTNLTAPAGTTRLLNIIVNATGTVGAKTFKLQHRKVGGSEWIDTPIKQ